MFDPLIVAAALLCGLLSRAAGLPALIGYLGAGFVLHELGAASGDLLVNLAELGVTLLLFTIGLKLEPRKLLLTRVWGTTLMHMALLQLGFMAVLFLVDPLLPSIDMHLGSYTIVAFALTFSSTVFVIQTMQDRGEMASRHAALAIGILIIQDVAAIIFLGFSTGKVPEPSAVLLLLLIPLRPVLLRVLAHAGHGELFTLCGLVLAIGGAQVFEYFGVKGDLGALIIGSLLAGHRKAKELNRNLLQFKDLFLVGFFLSIGLGGWPEGDIIVLAVLVGCLALLKPLLYFPLLTLFHTPPRTALLAAVSLSNYSEFGLIVIAVAVSKGWIDNQWAAAVSLAIATSFVLSSQLNRYAHGLYRLLQGRLRPFESATLRARLPDTSGTRAIILGMGNIGTGAYENLAPHYGAGLLGVDENDSKLVAHHAQHRRVVSADATDPDFWSRVNLADVELVMLALTNHPEHMLVGALLRDMGYGGPIAAVVRFAEEEDELQKHDISAFNLYAQAGLGFAAHADAELQASRE